ncbi:hypothetical protein F5887DRAFT_620540 [Amanita rubescens]|nr:hypothetical protein F5887DRAFT_620540 [Amanita rubescens]
MSAGGISEDSFLQFVLEKLEQVLPPGGLSNPKRYAIYLPSSRRSYSDALFTSETRVDSWDLTRSESTGSLYSRSSARPSMRESLAWLATDLSPASLPFVPKSLDGSKSAETSSTLSASSETYTPTSYTCLVEQDLRVRYTPSSHGALLDAHEEAAKFMRNRESEEEKGIHCTRPGCNDRLRDVRALTSHLHIHNMTDTFEPHSDFDTTHDSGCHISAQTCYLPSYIFPVKRVRKVISKILRRKGFQ